MFLYLKENNTVKITDWISIQKLLHLNAIMWKLTRLYTSPLSESLVRAFVSTTPAALLASTGF